MRFVSKRRYCNARVKMANSKWHWNHLQIQLILKFFLHCAIPPTQTRLTEWLSACLESKPLIKWLFCHRIRKYRKNDRFDYANELSLLCVVSICTCSRLFIFLRFLDNLLDNLQSTVNKTAEHLNSANAAKSREVQFLSPSNSTSVVEERSSSPAGVSGLQARFFILANSVYSTYIGQ